MHRIFLTVALAVVSTVPTVALAQDDNVNCEQYLAMNSAAQLDAIDAALAKSEEQNRGRHFGEDATDEEKLNYMLTACTEPEGSVTVDIIDMLGE